MKEFLTTLLQAVLVAAVPVCAAFIGKGLKALASYLGQKSENDMAKKYLAAVADAVATAVTYTSQVYVDKLKETGQFTKENQREAPDVERIRPYKSPRLSLPVFRRGGWGLFCFLIHTTKSNGPFEPKSTGEYF